LAIKVKLNLTLQKLAKNREKIEVTGSTIRQCLNDLIRQMPGSKKYIFDADGSLKILFLLNNEALHEHDLDHPIIENDELWLLSIVSGG
jgi:molybdopterin converting factor small subunit